MARDDESSQAILDASDDDALARSPSTYSSCLARDRG